MEILLTNDDGVLPAHWAQDAHAVRRLHAKVLGALVRRLGEGRFDIAEDALQDAVVRALEHWRYGAPPDDPAA